MYGAEFSDCGMMAVTNKTGPSFAGAIAARLSPLDGLQWTMYCMHVWLQSKKNVLHEHALERGRGRHSNRINSNGIGISSTSTIRFSRWEHVVVVRSSSSSGRKTYYFPGRVFLKTLSVFVLITVYNLKKCCEEDGGVWTASP